MPEHAEIIFVICDDEAPDRKRVGQMIERLFRNSQLPYGQIQFETMAETLEFMSQRSDTLGVILLTDGQLADTSGYVLLSRLIALQRLPKNSAVCSFVSRQSFETSMDRAHLSRDLVSFVDKQHIPLQLPAFLYTAFTNAAAEVGLVYPNPALSGAGPNHPQTPPLCAPAPALPR